MGTSTDYSAPPNWGGVKGAVTRTGHNPLSPEKAATLLRDYICQNGGSTAISSGRGQLGSAATAKQIAHTFAGFVHDVAAKGLSEALRQHGLQELVGSSVQETLLGIITLCGGSNGSLDAVDARNAFSRTMDELCKDAVSADEVETALGSLTDGPRMIELMMSFFGHYIFEQFCRVFFRQLIQKHGEEKAESFLDGISDYIFSRLENCVVERDVARINWFGTDGEQLVSQILQDTLAVYEN